jgi:uncharacterized membrane protein YhhN
MLTSILVLLVMLSACIHIRAEYRGPRQHVYIFKPLTMVFILLIAILGQAAAPLYKYMIIAGLVFSTAGDVFLMLPSDRFVAGLVAFLIAHLFYIVAFASEISVLMWWPLIPLATYGVVIYITLAPSLGKLKSPVLIYVVVILIMAWLAWERWDQTGQNGALLASVGAVLFFVSDTILAINRFRGAFKLARVLNLTTYFAAQCLIA